MRLVFHFKLGNKLSESVPAMFVASFLATLWQEEIFNICMVVCTFEIFKKTCSTSPPSGNQVDGLPLVAHTGENRSAAGPIHNYVWSDDLWT